MVDEKISIALHHDTNTPHSHDITVNSAQLTVTIDQSFVDKLFHQIVQSLQQSIETPGFARGATPKNYIVTTYKPLITEHMRRFFYQHCVHALLQKGIVAYKLVALGQPRLKELHCDLSASNMSFTFEMPTATLAIRKEWRKLHFKAPGRKNYKDLDRQVELFLQEESKSSQTNTQIGFNDWICISLKIITNDQKPLFEDFERTVWLRIGDEEADREAQQLFIGKSTGNSFISASDLFQATFNDYGTKNYQFQVTILHHIPYHTFDLERFKQHFKLKGNRDVHQKLIEIFSFRNDISLRRETVDKLFKTLFHHYPVHLKDSLIQEQQQRVLEYVQEIPDYQVYKGQHDFKEKIKLLAEKQLKEMLFIDSISYQENMYATAEDIINYLSLLKKPRTKEFIYFGLPSTRVHDQEVPICQEELRRYCQREKTLNYIIHYFNKKQ